MCVSYGCKTMHYSKVQVPYVRGAVHKLLPFVNDMCQEIVVL